MSQIDYIPWARRIARINNTIAGYPRFRRDVLRRDYESPDTPEDDTKRYSHFNSRFSVIQFLFMLYFILESLKNIYSLFYSFSSLKTMKSSANESELGCIRTNCTKLSENGDIKQDLIHLPWFVICHPDTKDMYNPVIAFDELGLILHAVLTYISFGLGVIVPLVMYLKPCPLEITVFLLSSTPWPRRECELARKSLKDVYVSMQIFFEERLFCLKRYRSSSSNRYAFLESIESTTQLKFEETQVQKLCRDFCLLDYKTKAILQDCLPLVRFQRWRSKVAEQYCKLSALVTTYFGIGFALYLVIFFRSYGQRIEQLREIEIFMSSVQCSMWRSWDEAKETIQLHTLLVNSFHTGVVSTLTLGVLIIGSTVSANFSLCFISIQELNIGIAEVMDRLRLSLEFTDQYRMYGLERKQVSKRPAVTDIQFDFKRLREAQSDNIDSYFGFKYLRPLRLDREFLEKVILDQIVDLRMHTNLLADLLVKTYVSNRLLNHLAKEASGCLSVVLPFCYLMCYGAALVILLINKVFISSSFSKLSFMIAVIMIIATNCILLAAARIQAKSKTLVTLIWQLVASTTYFEDYRISHMRILWIKQAQSLSRDGGLAIIAIGIPVTHSSVIQLVLASTTLFLFALGH